VCAADAAQPISAAEASRLFHPLAALAAVILAVSGGPDSMALLVLAARWRAARKTGPKLFAVTVDHGLRLQSASEAKSVQQLARSLDVPHRILHWRGRKPMTGLQRAARVARYRLLAQFARAAKAGHIATAHTLDDQAETVLMRMSRGSGITGLGGMKKIAPLPVAPGRRRASTLWLVRPFLDISKARLLATLKRAGVEHIEDASNRDPRFARARLRELMPTLAREGLDAHRIALFARRLERAETALEHAVAAAETEFSQGARNRAQRLTFDATRFRRLPEEIALRLLARAIMQVGGAKTVRLGKLEALHASLFAAKLSAAIRLRRALAGALVSLSAQQLVVERAPPRSTSRAAARVIVASERKSRKKAHSLGRRSPAT
jgi:tRNA(Ile)-lysidine synthase